MACSRTRRYSATSTSRSQQAIIRAPSLRKLPSQSITCSSVQAGEYCCIFSSGMRSKYARRLTSVSSGFSGQGSCSKFQMGCCILLLSLQRRDLGLQAAHAAEPAIVVVGLAADVFEDFRVRQDEELLGIEAFDHSFGHLIGFESAFLEERAAAELGIFEHARLDALRTESGDFDSLVAISD